MEHLRGSGPDGSIRWKTGLDHDEGGYQSPAPSMPYASTSANSRLSVRRRRSIYPPYGTTSTARVGSPPVHRQATSDISSRPEDANPFGQMRSSMGRLSLQSGGGMAGKTPLGHLLESTTEGYEQGDNEASGSIIDTTIASDFPAGTPSPLSIRSHIKEKMKAPDQDRNGMRINCSEELGRDLTPRAKNRHTTRRQSDHYVPKMLREIEHKGDPPDHRDMAPFVRRRKQVELLGARTTMPGYDKNLGHDHGSPFRVRPLGRNTQILPADPRLHARREENGSVNKRYSGPCLGVMRYPVSTRDTDAVHSAFKAKRRHPNSARNFSFSDSEPSPRYRVEHIRTSRTYHDGKDAVTEVEAEQQLYEEGRVLRPTRASNKFLNSGSVTTESTNGINFTISKDSSADVNARNAKLLAEMGERTQRYRGGNDIDSERSVSPTGDVRVREVFRPRPLSPPGVVGVPPPPPEMVTHRPPGVGMHRPPRGGEIDDFFNIS